MNNDNLNKLIILTGPTATGKTDLSISLAKALDGEIISADSAQVYKGLDIGSAKITKEEMKGIRHHLIDIYEPDFPFDVTVFQKKAKEAIAQIYDRSKTPIIVGGTGFYIQSVLYDIDFDTETEESQYRKEMEDYLEKTGDIDSLYEELKRVDPGSAEKIHKNNHRRVIRALEYYKIHGTPISLHNEKERQKEAAFDSRYYVLTMNRELLYQRIDKRVDIMKSMGLLEEVKKLRDMGYGRELTSMQAIGYKEIYEAFDILEKRGISIENPEYNDVINEAFDRIRLNTRHFAKRQLTWFRREKDVIWLDKDVFSENYRLSSEETNERILEYILKDIS